MLFTSNMPTQSPLWSSPLPHGGCRVDYEQILHTHNVWSSLFRIYAKFNSSSNARFYLSYHYRPTWTVPPTEKKKCTNRRYIQTWYSFFSEVSIFTATRSIINNFFFRSWATEVRKINATINKRKWSNKCCLVCYYHHCCSLVKIALDASEKKNVSQMWKLQKRTTMKKKAMNVNYDVVYEWARINAVLMRAILNLPWISFNELLFIHMRLLFWL